MAIAGENLQPAGADLQSSPLNFGSLICFFYLLKRNVGIVNPSLKGEDCKSSPATASIGTYPEEQGYNFPYSRGNRELFLNLTPSRHLFESDYVWRFVQLFYLQQCIVFDR